MRAIRGQYDQPKFRNLIHDTSYSIQFNNAKETTVSIESYSLPVKRRTEKLTGVKSLIHSLVSASIHHEGNFSYDQADLDKFPEVNGPGGASYVNDEFILSMQVFFYSQNPFPTTCKHH